MTTLQQWRDWITAKTGQEPTVWAPVGLLAGGTLLYLAVWAGSSGPKDEAWAIETAKSFMRSPQWLSTDSIGVLLHRPLAEYDEASWVATAQPDGSFIVTGKHVLLGGVKLQVQPDGHVIIR